MTRRTALFLAAMLTAAIVALSVGVGASFGQFGFASANDEGVLSRGNGDVVAPVADGGLQTDAPVFGEDDDRGYEDEEEEYEEHEDDDEDEHEEHEDEYDKHEDDD